MPNVLTEPVRAGEYLVSEGNGSYSREVALITGLADLPPGAVLGQVTVGATASAAALGTNTGNGTFGAIATGAGSMAGTYTLRMEDATHFVVEDPTGSEIGHGTTGVAYNAGGLSFTLTAGGTPFIAGDSFTIVPAAGSLKMALLNPAATDGTQVASAILYQAAPVSGGDVRRTITARHTEVNGLLLTWPTGITTNQQTGAIAQLASKGILVRT